MRTGVFAVLRASALALLLSLPFDARPAEGDVAAQIAGLCPTKPALDGEDAAKNARYDKCRERARFTAYEPNYVIFRNARDDENAIRMHYSFRYLLTTPDCMGMYRWTRTRDAAEQRKLADDTLACLKEFDSRYEVYLVYTGEFDFYMETRKSGPVVNRISNPGLHYRYHFPRDGKGSWAFDWWDIGIEHKSDGQASDPAETIADTTSANFGRYRAQVEYENGNHAYFDTISRDTNYLTAETRFGTAESVKMYARAKFAYFRNETAVTWGPPESQAAKMTHYDILRFIVNWGRSGRTQLQGEWTVGTKGAKTDSFNLGLVLPVKVEGWTLPLYFRAHWGPLNTLSDYTKNQRSAGVGLQFIF